MKIEVKAKKHVPVGILYARCVKQSNIKWIREDSKQKNLSLGEYLDEVINQLRAQQQSGAARFGRGSKELKTK